MFCNKCGTQIADTARFCPDCGAKQTCEYRMLFTRNGMSESDFIQSINQWLRNNPRIANVKCHFEKKNSLGLLANKYVLDEFEIKYELFTANNQNQYELIKIHSTDLACRDAERFIQSWKQSNPQYRVINWTGGTNSRGNVSSVILGGIGAINHLDLFIFCKYPRVNTQTR